MDQERVKFEEPSIHDLETERIHLHSELSLEQIKQEEQWGTSRDGYTAGGNFEDNPALKIYTVRKYQKMKG